METKTGANGSVQWLSVSEGELTATVTVWYGHNPPQVEIAEDSPIHGERCFLDPDNWSNISSAYDESIDEETVLRLNKLRREALMLASKKWRVVRRRLQTVGYM